MDFISISLLVALCLVVACGVKIYRDLTGIINELRESVADKDVIIYALRAEQIPKKNCNCTPDTIQCNDITFTYKGKEFKLNGTFIPSNFGIDKPNISNVSVSQINHFKDDAISITDSVSAT
ncbi:hypothetical protein [Microcystis phage Mel-JY01]